VELELAGDPKYLEETCPSAALSTTNPTWSDFGPNQGRRCGKPAINRLSYDTNFMELSPSWEAASCASAQEIPNILRKPKVHYRVHKSPLLVSILNHTNPIHTSSCLSEIHPPTSWSS
jgi:hypothetical protein